MGILDNLLDDLDETNISRQVGLCHDEARMAYPWQKNTVVDGTEYENRLGHYYAYHYERCIAPGGRMGPVQAIGRARQIIERDYRRRDQTLLNALTDARESSHGGMRAQLDLIANALREEATENFIDDVFSRHVPLGTSFDTLVAVMQSFLDQYGHLLPASIRNERPERYAAADHFKKLLLAYVEARRQTVSAFRGL